MTTTDIPFYNAYIIKKFLRKQLIFLMTNKYFGFYLCSKIKDSVSYIYQFFEKYCRFLYEGLGLFLNAILYKYHLRILKILPFSFFFWEVINLQYEI